MRPEKVQQAVAPKMPEPVRLPSPNDPDLEAARKKRMMDEEMKRRGRASTNLSGGSGGGSQPYSSTTLG